LFNPTGSGVGVADEVALGVLLEVPWAVGVAVGVALGVMVVVRVGVGLGALARLMVGELEPLHPPKVRMKASIAIRPTLRSEFLDRVISDSSGERCLFCESPVY
jgi:hypothetical protein